MFPIGLRNKNGPGRTTRLMSKLSNEVYFHHVYSFLLFRFTVCTDETYKKDLVRRLCMWAIEEGSNPTLLKTIFNSKSEAEEMMAHTISSKIFYDHIIVL